MAEQTPERREETLAVPKEMMNPASQWTFMEERFFYEYLRIAPAHGKERCCEAIACAMDTKQLAQVMAFYDAATAVVHEALKECAIDWANCPPDRLHKALVYHWDKTLVGYILIYCSLQLPLRKHIHYAL
jgi:hypothetical protein